MKYRSACWGWAAVLAVMALGVALPRGAAAGPATDALRPAVDQVLRILNDDTLKGPAHTEDRRHALRIAMEGMIDFPEAARRALALHWQGRTEAERAEFVALFKDLVTYTYIVTFEGYAGQTVAYTGETASEDMAAVLTKVQRRQGAPVPVEYRMHQRDGHWLVYDVVVEGISLVGNYRVQFNSVIRSSTYAELLRRIRTRIAALMTPADAGTLTNGCFPAALARIRGRCIG